MNKISNWKINVSITLICLGFLFMLLDSIYSLSIVVDVYEVFGILFGQLLASYFIVYIPIKIMLQYKRGNNK